MDAPTARSFSLALAGDLKLQLLASSGAWLREFYDMGGLRALVEVSLRHSHSALYPTGMAVYIRTRWQSWYAYDPTRARRGAEHPEDYGVVARDMTVLVI
jgi:hypothetical protein